MKKLILLVLSLVLCLCMVNTAFATTTPSDVVGTKYETAVKTLVESNVINGYEDGTYKPNENVTRAQLAKIICEALHLENVEEGVTFSDVAPEHWATSYIKIASKNNIITGYADGTFKPEANVTYAEAVTMIMRATGNDVGVSSTGKWYDNYMSKAKEKNILNNITGVTEDQNLNRGDTALLTYNMLQSGNVNTTTGSGDTGKQEGELVDVKDINKYNGIYKSNDGDIIYLFKSGDGFVLFYDYLRSQNEENVNGTIDIKLPPVPLDIVDGSKLEKQIVLEDYSIHVEVQMTKDGIRYASSSTGDDLLSAMFNNIYKGEYKKETIDASSWSGIYTNEKVGCAVILNEKVEGSMGVLIFGDDLYLDENIESDYTNKQIDYTVNIEGVAETVKITKTNSGIKLEASSTDSSSKLNSVNGEYKKVKD